MADKTPIDWADASTNPWRGCRRCSTGCRGCYAATDAKRRGWDFDTVTRTSDATFYAPLKWREPRFIFVCSLSDFFIEDADEWRPTYFNDVIRRCPQHTFLLLTKRPGRIRACLPQDWGEGWPNVWLGVSAENQRWARKRIPKLLRVPAILYFISFEPMLAPIELKNWLPLSKYEFDAEGRPAHSFPPPGAGLGWVIGGGESGPGARSCDPLWLSSLQRQCAAAEVPYFCKQLGGHPDKRAGDKAVLDGRLWKERPAHAS